MDADLLENFQYGLTSSGLSGADKTVLLLKLTDPSLKCIEQYQKLKYSTSKRPAIQFKGNSGVITFPSREAQDEGREFKFTIQPLHAPASSSFECIQQYRNRRGENKLDSLGSIQTKVTVSGTDDVYHTTQQKMKQADEEMKKVSTKEVQQNQFKPGHRVKRKGISAHAKKIISSGVVPAVSSSSSSSSYSSTTASNFNASSLSLSSSTSSLPSLRNSYSPSSSSSTSTSTTKSAIMGSSSSSNSSNRSSNVKTSSCGSKGGSGSSGQKSAHHNLSYRDRVVHLLALRPYKKPELLLRLHRDGIQTKEKNTLANILSQVATLARDNSYVLNKNLYNEVSMEWPLYSEEDKKLLKRRKGEFCAKDSPPSSQPSPNPPTTNSMSNGSSPSTQPSPRSVDHKPDTGAKTSSTVSQKRPLLPEVRDYKTKKPRIAHNASSNQQQLSPSGGMAKKVPSPSGGVVKKVPSPSGGLVKKVPSPSGGVVKKVPSPSGGVVKKVPSPAGLVKKVPSPSSTTNTTTTVGGTSSTSQSALSSPSVSTTRNSPEMCDSTGSGSVVSMTTTTVTSMSSGAKSTSSIKESTARDERQSKLAASGTKEERRPVGKESPSGDVSSTSAVPEYMMKYTTITSSEQRRRYKDDFSTLYPEYTKLHKSLESVKHKFKVLKDELNKTPQDSEQHEKIQMKVINEYNKIKQDPKYNKERWQELHGLLDHIKALVTAYDSEKMDTSS